MAAAPVAIIVAGNSITMPTVWERTLATTLTGSSTIPAEGALAHNAFDVCQCDNHILATLPAFAR
jgi:hypothetical protein